MQMERLKSIAQARPQNKFKRFENPRESEGSPLVRTHKKSLPKIIKRSDRTEFPTSFIRFGPNFYDANASLAAKEEAWKQVVNKSTGDEEETKEAFLSAIRRVEKDGRAAYADETLKGITESQFRWIMIKDGCFLLQLVLFILGAAMELGYPKNHMIFGEKQDKKVVYGWIESMFYGGNQIPLLVLSEFMKQTFFQKVIRDHEKWERPTDMLSKGVLYDLLILPAISKNNASGSVHPSEEQPSDLLHGLQDLVLGPKVSRDEDEDEDEDDDEDEDEHQDLEAGVRLDTLELVADSDTKQLSVCGLTKKGIHFRKSNGVGIRRNIQFKNLFICAYVELPRISLNRDTVMLFENLYSYEERHQQNEVRSYLEFINQIISTYEDVHYLALKGIFEVSKAHYKESFLRMLRKVRVRGSATNHEHRCVLQELRDYTSFPWEYFKYVAILVFFFGFIQTVFEVLSYLVAKEQLRQTLHQS